MTIPLFPLSGDPIHYGHIRLINRALKVFPKVKVLIASNRLKKYDLDLPTRLKLCQETLGNDPRILIDSTEGLLADYAYRFGHGLILRGIRTAADFEFESMLEVGHRTQTPQDELEFLYLKPDEASTQISSTLCKVILREQGDIRSFVPLVVKKSLEETILHQKRICVTGPIAAGKSYVLREVLAQLNEEGLEAHEIDMDEITYQVYESTDPGILKNFHQALEAKTGVKLLGDFGKLDKAKVRAWAFNDPSQEKRRLLSSTIRHSLEVHLRQKLQGLKGLIFLSAAVAAEGDWCWHSNNQVLLIDAPTELRIERLMRREGILLEDAKKRIEFSGTAESKLELLESQIKRDQFGSVLRFNNEKTTSTEDIVNLVDKLKQNFYF